MAGLEGQIVLIDRTFNRLSSPIFTLAVSGSPNVPTGARWVHFYFRYVASNLEHSGQISLFGKFQKKAEPNQYEFTIEPPANEAEPEKIKKELRSLFEPFPHNITAKAVWFDSTESRCNHKFTPVGDNPKTIEFGCFDPPCGAAPIQMPADAIASTYAIGSVHIISTYALLNFLVKPHFDCVREICERYKDVNLTDEKVTDVTAWEKQCLNDGSDFSVFRRILERRNWLGRKTYRCVEGKVDYYLRLSKYGVIEVREEHKLTPGGEPFLNLLQGLVGYRRAGEDLLDDQTRDQTLLKVVRNFTKKLLATICGEETCKVCERAAEHPVKGWVAESNTQHLKRQSYAVVLLRCVKCGWCDTCNTHCSIEGHTRCDGTINPDLLFRHMGLLSSMIEGTLVIDEGASDPSLPRVPNRRDNDIRDKSTWQNELCIFGTERCFIYFQPRTVLEKNGKVGNYEDYWRYLIRAIEHTISIRTGLQLLESATERYIKEVPDLVKEFDPEQYESKRSTIDKKVDDISKHVADTLFYLPGLREVCVPSTIFRSRDVIEKFAYLNEECFRFGTILQHIQQNIDEMTNFLVFFKQQQEQQAARRLSLIALVFTVTSILYISSSFIGDAAKLSVFKTLFSAPDEVTLELGALKLYLLVLLIIALALLVMRNKQGLIRGGKRIVEIISGLASSILKGFASVSRWTRAAIIKLAGKFRQLASKWNPRGTFGKLTAKADSIRKWLKGFSPKS